MALIAEVRRMEGSNIQGTKRDRDPEVEQYMGEIETKYTKVYNWICLQKREKWHREWLSLQNSSPLKTTIALENAEKNYHKRWEMLKSAHDKSFKSVHLEEAERTLEVAKLKWEAVRMQKEDFYTHKMETIFNCRTQLALEIVQTKKDYLLNLNAEDKDMLNLNFHPEDKDMLLEQRMSARFAQHRQQQQAKREMYEAMYEDVHEKHPTSAPTALGPKMGDTDALETFPEIERKREKPLVSSCTDAPPSEVPEAVYERQRAKGMRFIAETMAAIHKVMGERYPTATSAPIALGPNMDDAASSAVPSWTAPPT